MSLEFRPSVLLAFKDNKLVAVIGDRGETSILNASLSIEEIEELTQRTKSLKEGNVDINTYERDWWDEARG